ncbi:hypothetical protein R3P38DRAFT_2808303 [Favolaschia claudopus]|uniref:Uncharacterized protein n=1 Tax=Favolaschia claudopus TaxID=2862362 RepID=A0AAV9ZG61_9AGAR
MQFLIPVTFGDDEYVDILAFLSQPDQLNLDISNDDSVRLFLEELDRIQDTPRASHKRLSFLNCERLNIQAKQGIASHQDKRSLVYKTKNRRPLPTFLPAVPLIPLLRLVPFLTLASSSANGICLSARLSGLCLPTLLVASSFSIKTNEAGVVFALLIVLRDVFGEQGTPESTAICEWFQDVIDTAVNEVAMSADGTEVQPYAGPRDLRVFQLAKSYTKNLDEETKADHDTEVIAAVTITWATVVLPKRGCRSI